MSEKSAIEWTDATWNPTTGCTKVSPACANCYIERTPPFRIKGRKFVKGHIPIELHEERIAQPLHWRKPRRVFVNSLSDLFHDDIPDAFVLRVLNAIRAGHWQRHVFQVLTKRPKRMRSILTRLQFDARGEGRMWLENRGVDLQGRPICFTPIMKRLWIGVSAENQRLLDERLGELCEIPAAVRFVSAEPLLGALDFRSFWKPQGVDWVIVGGESGPRVRPTNPDWVRSIRDQCVAAQVPFFFKQWGGKTPKSGGRLLDGRTWDEMPSR